jgi:4-carboxymuconolactone decarboxylase
MDHSNTPRIPPLPESEWSNAAREAFAVLSSPGTNKTSAASNVVMAMAQHPPLAKAFYGFGRHLLLESTLPQRVRELVTLRVLQRYKGGEYDWHHHVRFAEQMGILDEEIEATKAPLEGSVFTGADLIALRAADELCDGHEITDETWDQLSLTLERPQIMDLVYTVGLYVMTSLAKAAFRIELEAGVRSAKHPRC